MRLILSALIVSLFSHLTLPVLVATGSSLCQRMHSCPSADGSYVCGDTGRCSKCPDNSYCEGGKPKGREKPLPQIKMDPKESPGGTASGQKIILTEDQKMRLAAISKLLKMDYVGAEIILTQLIATYPADGYGYIHRGYAKIQMGEKAAGRGDLQRGMELVDAAMEREPENAKHYYLQATAHRYLKQYADAILLLGKAIELKPDRKNYKLDLEMVKIQQKLERQFK